MKLADCHYSQLIAVSHNWVANYNATFGTAYNADDWLTAQTVNFQRWVLIILGRKNDPIWVAAVS